MADQTLACTYAALILQGTGKTDAATLTAVCKAAGVTVNPQLATQFAGFAAKTDFDKILKNVAVGGGSAAPAAAAAGAPAKAAAPAKEEKKKEPEPEEEEDFGMGGLF